MVNSSEKSSSYESFLDISLVFLATSGHNLELAPGLRMRQAIESGFIPDFLRHIGIQKGKQVCQNSRTNRTCFAEQILTFEIGWEEANTLHIFIRSWYIYNYNI